jgi:hypothetical protein
LDRGGIQSTMKAVVTQLGIKKKYHATPCATAMPPICWNPGSIWSNSNRSLGMSAS